MNPSHLLLGAVAVLGLACQSKPASAAADAATSGTAPVARIGTQVITAEELDKSIRSQLNELGQQAYDLRKQALDNMISKQLVEAKAKESKQPLDEFLAAMIARVPEPAEEECRALYERAKASGQVQSGYDQVKSQIVDFLKQQKAQQLVQKYVEDLKAQSKVEILLPPYLPPKMDVAATGPSRGPDGAPVTIVEFSDFQCPYCARAEPTVKDLMALEKYKGKIKLVYRDLPLPMHPLAPKAGEAAHCAGDQGKYWEMHDKLFAASPKLEVTDLKAYARELQLDGGRFDKCLESGEKAKVVAEHAKAGDELGVHGTPAFFVNGRLISGAAKLEAFTALIDAELASVAKK